jgi:hypothetical protein
VLGSGARTEEDDDVDDYDYVDGLDEAVHFDEANGGTRSHTVDA